MAGTTHTIYVDSKLYRLISRLAASEGCTITEYLLKAVKTDRAVKEIEVPR